jgi:drug/metabolite transporter (DMT)-like permease
VFPRLRFAPIDALLLLMTLIWGTNYSIVKHAFAEIDPQAFNAARMVLASLAFLAIIVVVRGRAAGGRLPDALAGVLHSPAPLTRHDWLGLAALGVFGHGFYQFLFIGGLALTSVATSSLMLAATPVVIALMSAAIGEDRVSRLHWAGAALSVAGIYGVVGHAAPGERTSLAGELMMLGAVCCWALYTLGARRLMVRHSPLGVTGVSMAIGTTLYVPAVLPHVRAVSWTSLGAGTWLAIVYSGLFALGVAYTIWYAAVRQIGSARTSVYSNVVPLVAMATAVIFLHEPLTLLKVAGAGAVVAGVALTRAGRR